MSVASGRHPRGAPPPSRSRPIVTSGRRAGHGGADEIIALGADGWCATLQTIAPDRIVCKLWECRPMCLPSSGQIPAPLWPNSGRTRSNVDDFGPSLNRFRTHSTPNLSQRRWSVELRQCRLNQLCAPGLPNLARSGPRTDVGPDSAQFPTTFCRIRPTLADAGRTRPCYWGSSRISFPTVRSASLAWNAHRVDRFRATLGSQVWVPRTVAKSTRFRPRLRPPHSTLGPGSKLRLYPAEFGPRSIDFGVGLGGIRARIRPGVAPLDQTWAASAHIRVPQPTELGPGSTAFGRTRFDRIRAQLDDSWTGVDPITSGLDVGPHGPARVRPVWGCRRANLTESGLRSAKCDWVRPGSGGVRPLSG